jgi:predicted O-methyltransferase YrrM
MSVGGNTAYDTIAGLPNLVTAAVDLARGLGFDHSCAPEQGWLLSVLARGWAGGHVGETGTGCGVGLAWMVEATDPDTSFVSIELDADLAAASADFFSDRRNVHIVHGDWQGLRTYGPFDLLVLDGGGKGKDLSVDSRLDPADGWLKLGGALVLDDFVPAGQPGASEHDAARTHWLNHPLLKATEKRLSPSLVTIVAVRIA